MPAVSSRNIFIDVHSGTYRCINAIRYFVYPFFNTCGGNSLYLAVPESFPSVAALRSPWRQNPVKTVAKIRPPYASEMDIFSRPAISERRL